MTLPQRVPTAKEEHQEPDEPADDCQDAAPPAPRSNHGEIGRFSVIQREVLDVVHYRGGASGGWDTTASGSCLTTEAQRNATADFNGVSRRKSLCSCRSLCPLCLCGCAAGPV